MSSPAELWLQHHTDVAELDDEPIYAAITIDLDDAATLLIRRTDVNPDRPQGLVLDADADLTVGELTSGSWVLWSDTSPAEVTVMAPPGRLTITNVWRDGDIVHGWTGWAGIVRHDDEADPHRIHLAASDGHDTITDDLVVEIDITLV